MQIFAFTKMVILGTKMGSFSGIFDYLGKIGFYRHTQIVWSIFGRGFGGTRQILDGGRPQISRIYGPVLAVFRSRRRRIDRDFEKGYVGLE